MAPVSSVERGLAIGSGFPASALPATPATHRPNNHHQSTSQSCFTSARPEKCPLFINPQPSSSDKHASAVISFHLPNPPPFQNPSQFATMKLTLTTPSLLLLSSAHQALAWGTLGHETVAFIAQNFVAADTKVFLSSILQDTSTEYLAKVATWADSFRYTKAGKFSEPFHFIDAEDNPPDSCSVTYSRDCGKSGCVVGAIQNYTTQLLDSSLDKGTINMAAKFIIHFVGDIHQPLHDEALDRGGNSIAVLFGGVATNLHHIWDTNMPEKLVGGYTLADAERWAATLTTEINTGAFKDQAASWLEGIDITDPVTTSLGWASQTNQFVCTTVLPNGKEGVENQELSGSYYEAAVPVIQLQIARAGYRLAKWLDLITVGVRTEL